MIGDSTSTRRSRSDNEYALILIPKALAECFCSKVRKSSRSINRPSPSVSTDSEADSDDEDGALEKSRESGKPGFNHAERLLFCCSKVLTFSLRDRTWRSVKVSQLGQVKFRDDAFKKLMIKGKHKTVVKAMVRSYLDNHHTSGDLIQGKRRGLIVLLHGSPGTGKRLTAGMSPIASSANENNRMCCRKGE